MRIQLRNILLKPILCACIAAVCSLSSIAQAPVANFTGTPLAGCSPLIVNFQDQSTGNPTSWSWDFGNGNTSSLQNPVATYFTPGNYTIRLTVTNTSGTNTLVRNQLVTVYEPPTVDFSADNTSGCYPLRVQFTDLSTAGSGNTNTSWQWDFGNGVTSTQQNPLAVYTTAGSFTVSLRVTNDKGCVRTIARPVYINVTSGVKAAFTSSAPTVCSAPAVINFTNSSTGPGTLSYQWDFGDGSPTSAVTNPSHTYTANGSYTVTLVANSSAGCIDTFRSVVPIVIGGVTTSFTAPATACTNEPVNFVNTSTPAPSAVAWTFGDGGTSGTISPTYTYSTAGTYTIHLYNNFGFCIDSTQRTIQINPQPVADFTAPVTTQCQPPLAVNFQDLSTGAVAWQWDFGDGSPAGTVQNPVHTYTSYGSFDVTLIATNSFGCKDTIVKPGFIVIRRAVISVAGLPVRGCVPYTINPVPTVTAVDAVTSWQWDFGDGSPFSTVQNPSHTYTNQGTYTVRLVITTSTGCNDTLLLPNAVQVGTKPHADFTGAPNPVCARQPVNFTDLTPPPVDEWHWDFGDGATSPLQHPTHVYNDTGYFDVTLVAVNNGCADTIVKNHFLYVKPPIARFTPTPDCNNRFFFSFTDQSVAPLTWEWDFGDGSPVNTTQNPTHTYAALGVYTVRLIVTNNGCADTTTRIVRAIHEIPDFSVLNPTGCRAATFNFAVVGVNTGNITDYEWDFGDGPPIHTSNPSILHTYAGSGTFTVSLTITDLNGCKDNISKPNYIRVNGPTADFSATNVAGCTGLTTTFNDLSASDGIHAITGWFFDFGDGNTQAFTAPPFTHTYNSAGTFSVKLIVTDVIGCRDSITKVNLVSASQPVPDFVSTDTLTCPGGLVAFTNTSNALPGYASEWDFGDGNTSTVNSPTHSYSATGFYDVTLKVTDVNGCPVSISKPRYIRVDRPIAAFVPSDTAGGCLPLQIDFTNTSTFYTSSEWDFGTGQGNSTLTNPTHFFATPGVFTVRLIVTSPGGCMDTAYHTITVYDTTGSRITYTPVSGCKPLAVSFNVVSNEPGDYFWDFGDGNTLAGTAPTANHTYITFGNFLPKLILRDPAGCLIALQGADTVYVTGAITKFGLTPRLLCDSGLVTFSDSTRFNDPVASYNWDFGDGGTSVLQNPVHHYSGPGFYDVQLATETQLGCRDTARIPMAVKVVQSPLVDIIGPDEICVNELMIDRGVFLRQDTSAVTWRWQFPNGQTSTRQNPPAQIYSVAGNFNIDLFATNSSGCIDSVSKPIVVHPLPTVTLPGQMTVQPGFPVTIPATYSPNTMSWLWTPATGLSCTTCATPDAGPRFNTTFTVTFTDSNGCMNRGTIEVIVICKNANIFIPNTFSPNGDGSNDVFYPRGKGLYNIRTLRVFNRWGEVVFERQNFPPNDPLSGWNGGFKGRKPQADVYVYQAEIECDNGDVIKLNGNISLIL